MEKSEIIPISVLAGLMFITGWFICLHNYGCDGDCVSMELCEETVREVINDSQVYVILNNTIKMQLETEIYDMIIDRYNNTMNITSHNYIIDLDTQDLSGIYDIIISGSGNKIILTQQSDIQTFRYDGLKNWLFINRSISESIEFTENTEYLGYDNKSNKLIYLDCIDSPDCYGQIQEFLKIRQFLDLIDENEIKEMIK